MKWLVSLVAVLAVGLFSVALAGPYSSLGYSNETVVIEPEGRPGRLEVANHDGTFEDAFCWQGAGCVGSTPPYYGCFAEAFDLTYGEVNGISIWLTRGGDDSFSSDLDILVWDGGVLSSPEDASVIEVFPGAIPTNVPMWDTVGRNDFPVTTFTIHDPFSVGYYSDFAGTNCDWFLAVDRDGAGGGHPWTNVLPDLEDLPDGWVTPDQVWGAPVASFGIAIDFTDLSDAPFDDDYDHGSDESSTWAQVKALYR